MQNKKQLQIDVNTMSKALGINKNTLKVWDEIEILSPKKNSLNKNLYDYNDYRKAQIILFLTRNLEMKLTDIKIILALVEIDKEIFYKKIESYIEKE